MRVTLISPDRSVYDGEAQAVVVPAHDGLVGVLPGHAPFVALLGAGQLTVNHGGGISRYDVAGGFAQVADDVVRVVAERADEPIKEGA